MCSAGQIWSRQGPVPSFLGVEEQLQQRQPESRAQWPGNRGDGYCASVISELCFRQCLRFSFWLTSLGSGPQSSTFLIVAEEATFLGHQCAMFWVSHLEVHLEPTPSFLPTILLSTQSPVFNPFLLKTPRVFPALNSD